MRAGSKKQVKLLHAKATYDTVNHYILLDKLEYYGFRGIVLEWFRNFLTNRKQIVNYRSIESTNSIVTCGVSQGSVLGPSLFLMYVHDISESLSLLSFLLFADDINLFITDKDIYVIYMLYIGRNCARGLSTAEGDTQTKGIVSPNVDRDGPVNNTFIFFLLRFKTFKKILLHPPTYVCWSRTRLCWWSTQSITNQNKTLEHDF